MAISEGRICFHQNTVKHWEKNGKIRDEIDKQGRVIGTWYKWYEVCDACGTTIGFDSKLEVG